MNSPDGEKVFFPSNVLLEGAVELWLGIHIHKGYLIFTHNIDVI